MDQSGDWAGSRLRNCCKVWGDCTSIQSESSLKETHLTPFFVQIFGMIWSMAFM